MAALFDGPKHGIMNRMHIDRQWETDKSPIPDYYDCPIIVYVLCIYPPYQSPPYASLHGYKSMR
jgi:hypothetical protein